MAEKKGRGGVGRVSRRRFLKSATTGAAGAGLAFSAPRIVSAATLGVDTLNVGIIGAGNQAYVLTIVNCVKIPGVQMRAVCDIWPRRRIRIARALKEYEQQANEYVDYREMLSAETDLDAVIVATPDWVHAEHTVACLEAGRHVYCEKEMSNDLGKARQMVQAARRTGKLLQIGHQRRSNPRYHRALEYVEALRAVGRITHVRGQWNRDHPLWTEPPKGMRPDDEVLGEYGYDTIDRLANWRWYRKFSGGAIADLGSHQIDVFHWFLHALPKSVAAFGGSDNYQFAFKPHTSNDIEEWQEWRIASRDIEWYDNILAVYQWDYTLAGRTTTVLGHYQICSTTSHGWFSEAFIGTEGSLVISESAGKGGIRREHHVPMMQWERDIGQAVRNRYAKLPDLENEVVAQKTQIEAQRKEIEKLKARLAATSRPTAPETRPAGSDEEKKAEEDEVKIGHTVPDPGRYYPPIPPAWPAKTEHMPHLENFFGAIRGTCELNCPAEVGYETAVSVLRANDALEAGRPIELRAEDYKV